MSDKGRRDPAAGNARFDYYDVLFNQSAADHPHFRIRAIRMGGSFHVPVVPDGNRYLNTTGSILMQLDHTVIH
jgi:hypothetical protein